MDPSSASSGHRCPLLPSTVHAMTASTASRRLDRSGSRIDHLNLAVPDLAAAVAFYEPVLASIGITKMLEIPAIRSRTFRAMTGFGLADVKPYFWLSTTARWAATCTSPSPSTPGTTWTRSMPRP